jgi:transposase-like protein
MHWTSSRDDAVVRSKAICVALVALRDGTRDILGLWIEGAEGAKFWMKVFNDLKTRGVALDVVRLEHKALNQAKHLCYSLSFERFMRQR